MSAFHKGNLCEQCGRDQRAVFFLWLALGVVGVVLILMASGCGSDVHRLSTF